MEWNLRLFTNKLSEKFNRTSINNLGDVVAQKRKTFTPSTIIVCLTINEFSALFGVARERLENAIKIHEKATSSMNGQSRKSNWVFFFNFPRNSNWNFKSENIKYYARHAGRIFNDVAVWKRLRECVVKVNQEICDIMMTLISCASRNKYRQADKTIGQSPGMKV